MKLKVWFYQQCGETEVPITSIISRKNFVAETWVCREMGVHRHGCAQAWVCRDIQYDGLTARQPLLLLFSTFQLRTAALRLIVRSGLDVPTLATRRLHACHHARAPSGGR